MAEKIRRSFKSDEQSLGAQLTKAVNDLHHDNWLIWDILGTKLHIVVCDRCHKNWWTMKGYRAEDGIYTCGENVCAQCLNGAYHQTQDFEPEYYGGFCSDVAKWLARYPARRKQQFDFTDDPLVQEELRKEIARY